MYAMYVINLAEEVYELGKRYTDDQDAYKEKNYWFKKMTDQQVGHTNWQHGATYLSCSRDTAARYASSNSYGSEILSDTFELFDALIREEAQEGKDMLVEKFRNVFRSRKVH